VKFKSASIAPVNEYPEESTQHSAPSAPTAIPLAPRGKLTGAKKDMNQQADTSLEKKPADASSCNENPVSSLGDKEPLP